MNYSLKTMLFVMLVAAIGCMAFSQNSSFWALVFFNVAILIFFVSVIGTFFHRGASRVWWGGQAIGMGLYGMALKLGLGWALSGALITMIAQPFDRYNGSNGVFIGDSFYSPFGVSGHVFICLLMGVFGGLVARYFHRAGLSSEASPR